MAQTHVLTFERPEKLQQNRAEKYSDLKLHFKWMFAPFWVHVLTKICFFLEQMVVYKIVCEKGAPKGETRSYARVQGLPDSPPRARTS